jgi:hypothetical protein
MNCVCCKKYGDCPVEKEPDGRDYLLESNGLNGIECTEYERDFITPEQYKNRTGREWNEYAPVWAIYDDIIEISTMSQEEERKKWPGHFYLCVMGDAIPPDDWKPEETP